MLLLNILYQIFIAPIEMGMQWVLEFSFAKTNSYGLALIILSLVVNVVLLPLYNLAEKWQQEERDKQSRMADKLKEIKAVFKGQERFMMLQTLYRQNNYHPLLAARNSVGFLIQIPFFFAAFHLLSNYAPLNGQSFWLFKDLGAADGLLSLGSWHINLMPFMMTAVNLASAYIYTTELAKKDKIQLYAFALFFLVVLYTSPVALVFYWTMNNVFSLGKNWVVSSKITNKIIRTPNKQKEYYTYNILLFIAIIFLIVGILSQVTHHSTHYGVTNYFTKQLRNLSLGLFVLFLLLHFIFYKRIKSYSNKKLYSNILNSISYLLLLIPTAPLLHYVFLNTALIEKTTIYSYISLIIIILSFTSFVLIKLFKRFTPPLGIFATTIAFYFAIFIMPKLTALNNWQDKGNILLQFNILAIAFIFIYLMHHYNKRLLLILACTYFATETATGIINETEEEKALSTNTTKYISELRNSKNIEFSDVELLKLYPIFYLTYDAYPNIETHKLYKINNDSQIKFLKENNFNIYNGTYSIGGATMFSLSSSLDLNINIGNSSAQREVLLGNSFTHTLLKKYKYSTFGIYPDSYYMRSFKPNLDYTFPDIQTGNTAFINSVLSGELNDTVQFDNTTIEMFLDKRKEVLSNSELNFIQSHIHLPDHNSFNTSSCPKNNIEDYTKRLSSANEVMRLDIETAIKNNPNAIIVIAGDHGPYLTKNCRGTGIDKIPANEISRLDVQDRYGAFVAIRWPEKDIGKKYNIQTVQDTMAAVISFLADDFSLFEKLRLPSKTLEDASRTSGVNVNNNILTGGVNDGEPLFLNREIE